MKILSNICDIIIRPITILWRVWELLFHYHWYILRKKCPYSEFFWSAILVRKCPYSEFCAVNVMPESIKKVKTYLSLSKNIYKLIKESPGIADIINLTYSLSLTFLWPAPCSCGFAGGQIFRGNMKFLIDLVCILWEYYPKIFLIWLGGKTHIHKKFIRLKQPSILYSK